VGRRLRSTESYKCKKGRHAQCVSLSCQCHCHILNTTTMVGEPVTIGVHGRRIRFIKGGVHEDEKGR
jgi:hypothetical protein